VTTQANGSHSQSLHSAVIYAICVRLHLPLHVSLILLQRLGPLASPSALSWLLWHRPSCFQGVGSGLMDAHSRLVKQAPAGSAGAAGDQLLTFPVRRMSQCGKGSEFASRKSLANMQKLASLLQGGTMDAPRRLTPVLDASKRHCTSSAQASVLANDRFSVSSRSLRISIALGA
jgi:hypothetical protein